MAAREPNSARTAASLVEEPGSEIEHAPCMAMAAALTCADVTQAHAHRQRRERVTCTVCKRLCLLEEGMARLARKAAHVELGVQSRVGGDGQAAQTCGVAAPVGCRCGSVRERVLGEMRATMAMAVLARARS